MIRWLAGIADRTAQSLERLGLMDTGFNPEDLRLRAHRMEGAKHIPDAVYPDGLGVACTSLERCSLSVVGRASLHAQLVQGLRNGIRLERVFQANPDLVHQTLNAPIIVTGLPRSGTTYLHRLLALHPDAREIPTWEVRQPLPGRLDYRRLDARVRLWVLGRLAPELDRKHLMRADLGEEELTLFDHTGWTPTVWRLAPAEDYLEWYLDQDPRPAYAQYRRWLQVLQAQTPHRRLVLKLPNHLAFLEALAEAVPEAHIIQCHRAPHTVVGSYASLAGTVHRVHLRHQDLPALGRRSVQLWSTHANRGLAGRRSMVPSRLTDVSYRDLRETPLDQVRMVHERAGVSFDPAFARDLDHAIDHRPQHAHGKHTYDLGDYGLTRDTVERAFQPYLSWAQDKGWL